MGRSNSHLVETESIDEAKLIPGFANHKEGKLIRLTTVELVTNALREKVLCGDLAPGEALRQEALAEEMGVSRVPIREAIMKLAAEGMLTVIPHRGAYVCELSIREIRETFDLRLRLEPWIYGEAIPRISSQELSKAERLVCEMDDATTADWGDLNWSLHSTLYHPAGRDLTIATLKRLHDMSDRYFRFQLSNVPIRESNHDEHAEMIEVCRRRSPEAGVRLLERHLQAAADQIISVVKKVLKR
jgi:DNA-binding GntR family transcriptional regulator